MLYVSNWRDVKVHTEQLKATHLISLLGVEGIPDTPEMMDSSKHLIVTVDDIVGPISGYTCPSEGHVIELIDFVKKWDCSGPLLVHCYAGVSRSMATALIIMTMFNTGREFEAARILRERAPHASPNERIVSIADGVLGLRGKLVAAVTSLGPSEDKSRLGHLVELPVKLS